MKKFILRRSKTTYQTTFQTDSTISGRILKDGKPQGRERTFLKSKVKEAEPENETIQKMVGEMVVSYKPNTMLPAMVIRNQPDVTELIRSIWPEEGYNRREIMIAIYLSRSNQLCGYSVIGVGGISACYVDNRLIYQEAILSNASSVIIAHNHPSGNTNPSDQDIKLTRRLAEGLKLLDMNLLDHIILTESSSSHIDIPSL